MKLDWLKRLWRNRAGRMLIGALGGTAAMLAYSALARASGST